MRARYPQLFQAKYLHRCIGRVECQFLKQNIPGVAHIWDQIVGHLLELSGSANAQLRSTALLALDKTICAILASDRFTYNASSTDQTETTGCKIKSFESTILSPLSVLYNTSENHDVRIGSLKILLHVLERHGEKLNYSWDEILGMLRSVTKETEKDLIALGFQCIRVIMNDGLSTIPVECLDECIHVTGAYGIQRTEINISLTVIGLLWTATDFIVRCLHQRVILDKGTAHDHGGNEEIIEDEPTSSANSKPRALADKLIFSVFSILRELGADERPEVRNSAIRTLFQIMGSHGHKLSESMWEDCLWNYAFPILNHVSHMAATSSKDEWQGKELGIRGGKAVHMLIHHSRNTAQKQWDETLVLVLGGITRILRSYFPFFQSLSNFAEGWDSLLHFITDGILNGSKEVALAANSCLQTIACSHCPKGSLPLSYLKTILDVYQLVLKNFVSYSSAANKVKQEILQGLGDIYVQAQGMFETDMYLQLLRIFDLAISQSMVPCDSAEVDMETVSPVQRTILEILPLLCPARHLPSIWPDFLQWLLQYIPGSKGFPYDSKEVPKEDCIVHDTPADDPHTIYLGSNISKEMIKEASKTTLGYDGSSRTPKEKFADVSCSHHLFGEKLVPILVSIFVEAPSSEKWVASPDIIHALGRCMLTRRDHPDSKLWKVAVEGFNTVLLDDVNKFSVDCNADLSLKSYSRTRFWKDAADVYENFLVGSCGRALSSVASSAESLKSDELLEITLLNVLGDKILKAEIDAPSDSLLRLISALDRCASRTCSLPVGTVGLLPYHCSRFSLICLQKIFSLCSFTDREAWHPARSNVSRIAASVLTNRCKCILNQFLADEKCSIEHALPPVRVEEMVFVLKELSQLVLHPETARVIQLPEYLRKALSKDTDINNRTHLLFLFPSLCELVVSRERRVTELIAVLLKLISKELGFQ